MCILIEWIVVVEYDERPMPRDSNPQLSNAPEHELNAANAPEDRNDGDCQIDREDARQIIRRGVASLGRGGEEKSCREAKNTEK